jgi:hypothetical protein
LIDHSYLKELAPFFAALATFFTGFFIPKFNFWISNEHDFRRKINFAKSKIICKYSTANKTLIDATLTTGVDPLPEDIYSTHSENVIKISIEAHRVEMYGHEGKLIYLSFLTTGFFALICFALLFIERMKLFICIALLVVFIFQVIILFRLYWIERFINKYEEPF